MTRHGQLVADWVEVFAPSSSRPEGPGRGRRPARSCSMICPSRCVTLEAGAFGAFRVFGAAGFERGRPKLWRVEAFPDASQANWGEAFLRALEGAPQRVVCDNHHGLNGAVRAAFPEAELYLCEWHLRHTLERLMAKLRQSDEHRAPIDALLPSVEAAFAGPSFWRPFIRDAHAAGIPRLSSWLEGAGRVVEDQFRRPRPAPRAPGRHAALDLGHGWPHRADPSRPPSPPLQPSRTASERTGCCCSCNDTPTARTTCSPTPRTSECGWRPITAAHACPPRCHQPTQQPLAASVSLRAPLGSDGGGSSETTSEALAGGTTWGWGRLTAQPQRQILNRPSTVLRRRF